MVELATSRVFIDSRDDDVSIISIFEIWGIDDVQHRAGCHATLLQKFFQLDIPDVVYNSELDTGRVDPRVGLGRVK